MYPITSILVQRQMCVGAVLRPEIADGAYLLLQVSLRCFLNYAHDTEAQRAHHHHLSSTPDACGRCVTLQGR